MELLDFARGPGMRFAVSVFVVGLTYRLLALLLRRHHAIHSAPRSGAPSPLTAALGAALHRSWPSPVFRARATVPTIVAYTFHLGLLVIVALGTPHILFIAHFAGFGWPGLPKGIIDVVSGLTLGALLFALWQRLWHPVRRRLSTADDYASWTLVTLPVVTGLAATAQLGGRYETLLALHILSFELMLIWFPFGKLMHAFLFVFSRGVTGARYARRGVET